MLTIPAGKSIFLLILSVLTSSTLVDAAEIELERSYSAAGEITSLCFTNNRQLAATDQHQGALLLYAGDTIEQKISLAAGKPFNSPKVSGLACTPAGQYILVNQSEAKIAILDNKGVPLTLLGESGSKVGMLDEPAALSYSINDRIYVADRGAARVTVYNRAGTYLQSIGNAQADPAQRLKKPEQVAVDQQDRVYVLETGSESALSIYNHEAKLLKRISHNAFNTLLKTKTELVALAVDKDGRVFLADRETGKIFQYDWESNTIPISFGSKGNGPGQYQKASAITAVSDRLAIADSGNHKIDIYKIPASLDKTNARNWLPNVGTTVFIPAACTQAYQLHDTRILCLNNRDNRVQILSQESKVITNLSGTFKDPRQAAYTHDQIAILDKNKIMLYSMDGKLTTEFGRAGSSEGQFDDPEDLWLQGKKIYVAESGSRRIQIFSEKGVYLDSLIGASTGTANFNSPIAVAVDNNGNLYIADQTQNKIFVYSADKKLLYTLSVTTDLTSSPGKIIDLALDADNNLYLLANTAQDTQTIQIYNSDKQQFQFGIPAASEGRSLSVPATGKTIISLFDASNRKNPGIHQYPYQQIPSAVSSFMLEGDTNQLTLHWQKPVSNYTQRFKIYAAANPEGPYTFLQQTDETHITLPDTESNEYRYYQISSISTLDIEGPASVSQENLYKKTWQTYLQKDYSKTAELLKVQLEQHPEQPALLKLSGLTAFAQKQYDTAQQYFQRFSQTTGHEAEGLNLQINALFENKQYAEAMQRVQQAIKLSENKTESYLNCGRLSLKIDDPVGAVNCLENALKLNPQNPEASLLLGEAYVRIGATEKGLAEIEKSIAMATENISLLQKSAELYNQLKKTEQARQQYKKILALEPANTAAQLGLAEIFLANNEYAEAKNMALTLAGQSTTAGTGHYLLGKIALHNQTLDEAVLELNKAIRETPEQSEAWLALSDTYATLQQPDKSKQTLENALQYHKNNYAILKRLGLLYIAGSPVAAADMLQQAAQLNPHDSETLLAAATALLQQKKYASADEYARKALTLEESNPQILLLLARIAEQSGKTGAAIEHTRNALGITPNDVTLNTFLGQLYLTNNLYEDAEKTLEKSVLLDKTNEQPYLLLGQLYRQRRLFDKAIKAFETAVQLNDTTENRLLLDTAYAEKKNSLQTATNAPALALEDLKTNAIFSAAYKQYTNKPIGSVKIHNTSGVAYQNLTLSFNIKGFMDFPVTRNLARIDPQTTEEIPLIAAFNNKVLEIDEDTGVQAEIKLDYTSEGHHDNISVTQPMTIYGKNAIVWNNSNMIGSFVTAKDDTLRDFVRRIINEYKPEKGPVNDSLLTAMTVFNTYAAYGLKYQIDPTHPFTTLKGDQIDYVQFPRETLKLKSGDCDDLSVLLSASLENMGIETAIADVPGHLFMLFNTGMPAEQRTTLSGEDQLLVIHENQIWIPLESTMIATNFMEAWAEGANKYHTYASQGTLKTIFLKNAWQEYPPVTLAKIETELTLPEKAKVNSKIQEAQKSLLEKSLARLVLPYEAMRKNDPQDPTASMQIAIIYARYGLYEKAMIELERLTHIDASRSAAYNNIGNIHFAKGEFAQALEAYTQAEKFDPADGGIQLNLAMTYYKQDSIPKAKAKFADAARLDKAINEKYAAFGKLLNQ